MTYTPPKHLGEAREPYRRNGEAVTHAGLLREHIKAIHADENGYEHRSCEGVMMFHGQRVAREDGVMIVQWDGDALFRNAVCSTCGETWAVETAYRQVLRMKTPEVESEDVW
jgi:hypothetical protein